VTLRFFCFVAYVFSNTGAQTKAAKLCQRLLHINDADAMETTTTGHVTYRSRVLNPLDSKGNYSAASNNTKLVH